MKNVVNWTIGSFFRTIGRIVAYIGIGCLLALILSKSDFDITNLFLPKLSAATLTPKSTYTDNTNHIIGQDISAFGSNNTYSYSTVLPNLYGEFLWENASTGTSVSGKAYSFSLGFQYNLTAQKYYDITINFRDRDLRSVVNTSSIYLMGGTSISGLSSNNLSLIGVTNTATSSSNTNKLVVRVYSVQAISYFVVQIYNMQNNITSVNNFGISSVSIQEVDITNSQAIINNQTNNTQNIINNNNDNTQQIIDNQNELLGSKCSNMLDLSNGTYTNNGITAVVNNGVITLNGTASSSTSFIDIPITNFTINANTYYTLFAFNNSTLDDVNTGIRTNNTDNTTSSLVSFNSKNNKETFSFTSSKTARYLTVRTSSGKTFNNFVFKPMIIEGSSSVSWCLYGTTISKLDDTTNSINNINDSINDDTISDDKVNNAINGMEIPQTSLGPFAAFLTIPLQWVQTILGSGQTCETLHLPLPFVNRNLDLPCMTDFWTSTGAIGTLIQACWICVVAVRIFNGLFLLTVDVLNPNPDSAAELTKIKSWEL